jgi:hypothetical protein
VQLVLATYGNRQLLRLDIDGQVHRVGQRVQMKARVGRW